MPITSERLLFRRYHDDDFNFLMSLLSDAEVVRFIGNGKTRDENEGKRFLKWIYSSYESGENLGLRLLVHKADNTLIGHAGVVPQTIDGREEMEIGYWISRKYWGKGYATEAAKTLLHFGSEQLGTQRFISLIQPDNLSSQHVAKKIGMAFDKEILLGGQRVYLYSIDALR
ncbi:GNAT family N-acetyltransferase [Oceanobacillus jeddahense]|uniref:GNAT family N-acetyltransferase n=1 Tax=Oceanobacillus jeddahense TaxID=1462527 RepID=A0ABY5K0U2_9BACI|nr:GNAT family N-acetyltransferase [Oceanobacillus jeddahense]UUI04732.1 GNAT family N-acetyltransferase [Oceanobacillus jeddahense]